MKWTEVSVLTASEAVEAVSNILVEAGTSGVSIEDFSDFENTPDDGFGQIWALDEADYSKEGVVIKAYFPETIFLPEILPSIQQRILELKTFGLDIGPNEVKTSEVSDTSWATAWKKYYHPLQVTRFMTVVPSWEEYTPKFSDERIIRLDPGLAFGTGTHPTTRLSMQALETSIVGGETILDVGTGSGVLSIASKALGAGDVYAYDLDEVAVRAAKENMDLNDYAKEVQVAANDLLKGIAIKADIVMANILAEIILLLIEDAWRVLKPNGLFITSGIIDSKKDTVLEQLLAQGFEIEQVQQMKDWFAIIARKPLEED
ncbi:MULTISPECIES: 50S ribosomal protein L11 methyltransferase [Carnobacterium]|uniref:50S ribosomal protein L11 methyltransferase n=1 Tax=Carnobacterium TaxID=2747 RepID=UPI002891E9FB|nr:MULTISPECIES: 50S ribosomal protein L11 methyltransferase [Carnobacterium]MDT1938752.1 50S ribosomal protein L11 methyltransferase [Carnobacterium divergens]MDT1941190.1 50S ribosomal protein L11 methyltransferase [Carnobacterium divergens]MDT1946988.1 50S ribosomal protein L11 methyltransferase [Carnobacterium divergens]MDT1949425.1 50S ribosomal protein L11 methyltransferase [Carnobacterium divergens]MDT1954603.1 50S ribosomal protein L11 methyltransferase [Carnobacterium divergens]